MVYLGDVDHTTRFPKRVRVKTKEMKRDPANMHMKRDHPEMGGSAVVICWMHAMKQNCSRTNLIVPGESALTGCARWCSMGPGQKRCGRQLSAESAAGSVA